MFVIFTLDHANCVGGFNIHAASPERAKEGFVHRIFVEIDP